MEKPDYKNTINLPKTSFPMKANLAQKEPETLKKWEDNNLYQKMIDRNQETNSFVMPDGPPYANGNIHLGHTLNKVLKDIIIKYKNLSGKKAPFIPGWDCHGLPIELKVTKALGSKKNNMSNAEIRDLCRKEANKWVNTQRDQFKRLGILADWDNPYLTLDPEYEADEVRVLADIFDNGILVRGEKPVYWCPALQTALAAAEVEYHDHTSPSIYVKFNVEDEASKMGFTDKPISFVIWTTTPWTLPANYAISLNPNFEYGVYELDNEYLIFAKELVESIEKATELKFKEVKTFKGSDFKDTKARHPFIDRDSIIVFGDHVTLEAGTGCVHTAPGHGLDDYQMGLKYNLPISSPVGPNGKYTDEYPELQGTKIWDANKIIVENLVNSKHMLFHTEMTHSYPHNPRSKTPLIFRATPQWFIKMDDEKYNLRQKALSSVENDIQFVPNWGSQRLNAMLSNSPDWCVSRQRLWGVPIPVFYCEESGEALISSELMRKVADKMSSSGKGIEAYFESSVEELIGDQDLGKFKLSQLKKGEDILDVWFDSGICHTAVQKKRDGLKFPADIYLEGSDQHRGWFQTSLNSSLAANGEAPFKTLITHGFVNDSKGHKMSKSKGNYIDPAEIIKKSGAEILRLWVSYEDYGQDVNIGGDMFQRLSETYRRIRNTVRFMLGNLNDFSPEKDMVEPKDMPELDRWALHQLNELIEKTTEAYESYNFYKVYHALNNFFTVDLSATYLDILKDRLYTAKTDGNKRRSSQTVIYHLVENLTGLMAPILSFLAEETYSYLPKDNKQDSVFLTDFPKTHSEWSHPEVVENFEKLFELRSEVSGALEELRKNKVIGSSLDAQVKIQLDGNSYQLANKYKAELPELFIVSQVKLSEGPKSIEVDKAEGEKCSRCWYYSVETGANPQFPEACPKCVEALS